MATDQVRKLRELLESFGTAMLITQNQGHSPRGRPMAIAQVEADCSIWFFTGRNSGKVHEIQEDQHALVVCQDEHSRYVSVSGFAELVRSRDRAHELWRETYRTWFPGGVDDPDLLLIVVRPEEAEYWDNQGRMGSVICLKQ